MTIELDPAPAGVIRHAARHEDELALDSPRGHTANLASLFAERVERHPDRTALVVPRTWDDRRVAAADELSFGALAGMVGAWQYHLRAQGVHPGDRVLVLVPPSLDLYAPALAVLASGMSLVLVDPGMSLSRARAAVATSAPAAVIFGHRARHLVTTIPELRRIPKRIPADARPSRPGAAMDIVARRSDDEAIVSFTSGSTGRPKGADRTHGLLLAQHRSLTRAFPYVDGDVDMTAWPVVVLHDLLSGIPSVLPPMRPGKFRQVPGAAALRFAAEHGVTLLNGPPAFLDSVLRTADWTGITPALRRIITGGGPVHPQLCRQVLSAFEGADGCVLYGGTEAEPISWCAMEDVIAAGGAGAGCDRPGLGGAGLLVGRPVDDIAVRIFPLDPAAPAAGPAAPSERDGTWGEVGVRGDHVLARWIAPGGGRRQLDPGAWLRTGDVARFDTDGRLWLGGRISDTVTHAGRTIHPYVVESVLDGIPGIRRSAVMQGSRGRADVYLDCTPTRDGEPQPQRAARIALDSLGLSSARLYWPARLPVDGRHNSKVDRPRLRARRGQIIAAAAVRRIVPPGAARGHRHARPVPAAPEEPRQ